jgi:hypothetical protein
LPFKLLSEVFKQDICADSGGFQGLASDRERRLPSDDELMQVLGIAGFFQPLA